VELAARELGVATANHGHATVDGSGRPLTHAPRGRRDAYQNEADYVFDSAKFERRFAFTPTPYEHGIRETVRRMRAAGDQ
jgi:hypothetical protein